MIIARLVAVDADSAVNTRDSVYLAEVPFPGDIVVTARGQRVRVLRREFLDKGTFEPQTNAPANLVDARLHVRLVGTNDG